jgi:glycosyltransferase involved in cell wall biosynthesis
VIPVKDGGALLDRVVAAVRAQGELELIVIDSGSRDGSTEVARRHGAELIEIPPRDFGHGRTRNLGMERASGELVCFLTQDAIPEPGWLDAYREAFRLAPDVGAAFGPHLAHPDTTPMIARELTEFFAGFSPDGRPALQRSGDATFLSNVNACYARACWEGVRFPDVPYAEDQAFGRAMLEAGWAKAYHPQAAVRHAHDYRPIEFVKRYFDEYRGLRETSGHVEPVRPLEVARQVVRDARWMRERGMPPAQRGRWLARSAVHHSGRQVGAALGSRSNRLPRALRGHLSLEGRDDAGAPRGSRTFIPAVERDAPFEAVLRAKRGQAPLEDPVPGMAETASLHVAVLIPPFQRGSGGHNTIFTLVRRLEDMGHDCTIWMYDPERKHHEGAATLRRRICEEFVELKAPVFNDFAHWHGADVAVATGWDTAWQAVTLPGCRARAYLINDHEPEFFPTSVEAEWAAQTYELGLYGISASTWLRDMLTTRYGQRGVWFRLGVDHTVYQPRPLERDRDTVIFYARRFTPRRAVPLGTLALQELYERRPQTRFVLFGDYQQTRLGFPYELLGITSPGTLAQRYCTATVGLCLSLTNYSLIPQEMMACGLPCVDLAGSSTDYELGRNSGVEMAERTPEAIADALERLLDDRAAWARRSHAGLGFAETASWDLAARQVEAGLRAALREREQVAAGARES